MRGKTAILLLVLVVLLFFADQTARHYEESQVGRSIKSSLNLDAQPEVDLRGFPFLTEMAGGRISSARVAVSSLTERGIRFSDIRVLFADLRFSFQQFLKGNLRAIRADSGVGTASVKQSDLNAFLRAHAVPFTLAFENGHTVARLSALSAPIDIALKISDGSLQVSAGSLPAVSVPLPTALHGIVYGSAHPGAGRLLLDFRMHHPTLDLTH
jgi:hypothetical protein